MDLFTKLHENTMVTHEEDIAAYSKNSQIKDGLISSDKKIKFKVVNIHIQKIKKSKILDIDLSDIGFCKYYSVICFVIMKEVG